MRKSKADDDEKQCEVSGCNLPIKRAVSQKKFENVMPDLKFDKKGKRIHLCKDHYKEFKKVTKKERTIDHLTWD